MKATILIGDVLGRIKEIPDQTIQCCVTSPPYWGLRDYGHDGQLGLEPTPEQYVENMVAVFREVRRILKDDGVLWLNLGDSYAGAANSGGPGKQDTIYRAQGLPTKKGQNLKPKDLVGIPWRVAFALQADGWHLRQDIIWHKPNPMPESVTDRCTKAHEYLFMLTKSARYYFDNNAIKEPATADGIARQKRGLLSTNKNANGAPGQTAQSMNKERTYDPERPVAETRNKRSVWTINTKPFKGAHFAVMPEALCEPPILATSQPDDIVFDPFTGSGTVATVALRQGRNYLGIELNPDYSKIAYDRITQDQPMFNNVEISQLEGHKL